MGISILKKDTNQCSSSDNKVFSKSISIIQSILQTEVLLLNFSSRIPDHLSRHVSLHTSTFSLASEVWATLAPERSFKKVLRHPLIMRGPAPSQNRFARSTAFIHSQTQWKIRLMAWRCKKRKLMTLACTGKIKRYLINHNLVPCAKNSNLRHCHVEDTELQNSSRWLILRHERSELV